MPVAKNQATETGQERIRIFATRKFAGDARTAGIANDQLRKVARAWASKGVGGDPLGAGVVKARLRNGDFRALFVEKEEVWIIFAYLFDKQDEKNVGPKTLTGFKKLAKDFKKLPAKAFEEMLRSGALVEICKND